jgi:hypothetical protein
MQWLKSKKCWITVIVLLALSAAASYGNRLWKINKAQTMSEEILKPEQPNPFCFGRLMIDLPRHAVVTGSLTKHPGAQEIEMTEGVAREVFEETVDEFEQSLRKTRHEVDPSLLKTVILVSDTPDAKLFIHWENDYTKYGTVLTGYRWLPNKTQYKFVSTISQEFLQGAVKDMTSALVGLRPRPVNDVPTEPGFCIEGGFFPDTQTGEWLERSNLAIDFAPWADMNVSIESGTNHKKEEETLLDRIRAIPEHLPVLAGAMNILRSGSRAIGPHKGEEVLVELSQKGRRTYSFVWEVQGAIDRNDLPDISVEMRIGHGGDHPMPTEEQMLAAWEYILSHLRVRPTEGQGTSSESAPTQLPLGKLAHTGLICPQTGWWQCVDSGNVEGGRRQHFNAGEQMPDIVLLGKPSLWQRLKGEQPAYRTITAWKLVEYDEGPKLPAAAESSEEGVPPTGGSSDGAIPSQADASDDETPPSAS